MIPLPIPSSDFRDPPASARSSLAALVLLLASAGCGASHPAGDHGDGGEHAGHVIPAHKPKDFPSAVRRLRELDGEIASKLAAGEARSLVEGKTLPIALDIANWLPEIAADSDMPEVPWDEVDRRSASLVVAYRRLLDGAGIANRPADAPASAGEAGSHIKALEALLDSADPR